jgi:hypothetical protein
MMPVRVILARPRVKGVDNVYMSESDCVAAI